MEQEHRVAQNRRRLTPYPNGAREVGTLDAAAGPVALAGGRDGHGFDEVSGREAKLFFGRYSQGGVTLNPLAGVGLNPLKDLDLTEG